MHCPGAYINFILNLFIRPLLFYKEKFYPVIEN